LISAVEDGARRRHAADIMPTTHERGADAHEFYRRIGCQRTANCFYKR
jgi:hypothetical protein